MLAETLALIKMNRPILFYSLLGLIMSSCQSPSDKQHSCECDYGDQEEYLIKGVNYFQDLTSATECDQRCDFKRLLIYFYDDSEASKKMNQIIESDKTLINDLNDNFSVVFLSVDDPTPLPINEKEEKIKTKGQKNRALQLEKFKTNSIPLFGIMNSGNDFVLGSFGLGMSKENIDSVIVSALTGNN